MSLWELASIIVMAGALGWVGRDQFVHRRAQKLVRKLRFEQMKARCPSCAHYDSPCDTHAKELKR